MFWVLGLLAFALVVGACGRGSDSESGESTPGFDNEEATVDTRPFDFRALDGGSATTLPEDFFAPGGRQTTTTTTAPTTTAPATTTTTTPPLLIPEIESITSICGFRRSVISLFPDRPMSQAQIDKVFNEFMPALARFIEVSSAEVVGDLQLVQSRMQQIQTLYVAGGRSIDYPPLVEVLEKVRTNQSPFDELTPAIERISFVEARSC